ncbi:hypothetical protein ACFTZB_23960 [Rhodococcus sp. NPDC057014]|uniref:hypothetical protein n=1 Tax=Rhodococcus sp. NPDC057014 TaxID=3346000 RepID=UPI0036252CDB
MYDPPMTNLLDALEQIERANARPARTTIAGLFTYELDPYTHEETNVLGITTAQQRVRLTCPPRGSGSAAGCSSPGIEETTATLGSTRRDATRRARSRTTSETLSPENAT